MAARAATPPAPITDTNVNCEAPVNATTDITHVWTTLKPAATERTPNETAYSPVASPIESASQTIGSRVMDVALSRDLPRIGAMAHGTALRWQYSPMDSIDRRNYRTARRSVLIRRARWRENLSPSPACAASARSRRPA